MDYLLDSDTIIDVLKNRGAGVDRFEKVKENKLFLSIISWMEVGYGLKKPADSSKKQNVFDNLLTTFNIQILPLDIKTGKEYLEIKLNLENKKTPLGSFDLIIAATAIANNLTLVTGNLNHFKRIPNLKIL